MRLYEISCNEEQWCVKGNRDDGYTLVNRTTLDSYSISGDVIGIEQISDDTFLVYRRTMRDEWQINRVKLSDGKVVREYHHEFQHFNFLTEDIIIFNKDSIHGGTLYSISKNCEMDTMNHMVHDDSGIHDASCVSNRKITLLYDKEDSDYPSLLLVDDKPRNAYRSEEYLQVFFDPNSLQPLSPVYSTLRNQYLTLTESYTLKDIMQEENHYLSIIDNFLYNLYNLYLEDNRKTAEELFSMLETKED